MLVFTKKHHGMEYGYLSPATRLKRRRATRDGGPCMHVLTGVPDAGEPWEVQLTDSPGMHCGAMTLIH